MAPTDLWAPAAFDGSLHRAYDLFTWLAMKGTAPFLPRFALGIDAAAPLRDIAREYLTIYEGLDLRADAWPPKQFERALDQVDRNLGPAVRTVVTTWHAVGLPDASIYSRSMLAWFHVLHDVSFYEQSPPALLAEALPILRARLSPDSWLAAVDAAKEPSDEWESLWYDMWAKAVGHGTSPIDGIRGALNFNDLHDAWFDMRGSLEPPTLGAIRKWVQRRASKELWSRPLPALELAGWDEWLALRQTGDGAAGR